MLKEALNWLKDEFQKTEFYEEHGERYSNVSLYKIQEPTRRELETYSLTGLVDFLKDNFDKDEKLIVQVLNERKVFVETELNNNKEREAVIVALADVPDKILNAYMDLEQFNIQLQSLFVETDTQRKILSIIGNLKTENVKNIGDNGTTQLVETKKGVTMAQEEVVPNPVELKPFRTFTEVPQPESMFVFRLREFHDGVQAALYEADGGAWRNQARLNIKAYLEEHLEEEITDGRILLIG